MTLGESQKTLFSFGHGYTCDYLAYELAQSGDWQVCGTTRDHEKKAALAARGIKAYLFDYECPLPDPLYMLRDVTHLLISTPPDDAGDPAFNAHAQAILELPNLEWVGYLSTTGVYGDRGGELVDETAELRPSSKRGSRRAKAEEQWMSLHKQHGLPLHIFRLSGIYGPGRSALDSVRAGVARRVDKPGHMFSRIHVEDIVQILRASMAEPAPGTIYNVCDDHPAPSHEVISHACDMLGLAPPPLVPFAQVDLSPMGQSFYADNKRVCNNKIKNELGVNLKYPDYKTGLQACLDAEQYAQTVFQGA